MKKFTRMIALVLAMLLLLTGCSLEEFSAEMEKIRLAIYNYYTGEGEDFASFEEMEYVRPDMEAFNALKAETLQEAGTATDVAVLMEKVDAFFEAYQWFYTYYNLADIHYCIDMTDAYWQAEYNYCTEQVATADGAREEVLYALADSPLREALESDEYFGADYFVAYEGENIYDEQFTALLNREAAVLNEYYRISADAASVEFASEEYYTTYGTQLADNLVELVKVRQELAVYCGYESYPAFAYQFYHGRDFTPEQAEEYMEAVADTFAELYRQVNTQYGWDVLYEYCGEQETFAYVEKTAKAMGGSFSDGFWFLEEDALYHIAPGENKYNSSFEVYLTGYDQPFIFMNPAQDGSDKLTFVHEFGHYMADYYTWGSIAGTDVQEVFSQAMEFLSLIYADADRDLVKFKLASSLCTYVEQSAYALFEQRLYELEGDALTAENIRALYEQTGSEFGFDSLAWDSRDFVTVPHFYSYPMYVISYVVSNDLALQIYQQELEESGAGLATYDAILSSESGYIMDFAQTYGLENPLDPVRLAEVKNTLSAVLED